MGGGARYGSPGRPAQQWKGAEEPGPGGHGKGGGHSLVEAPSLGASVCRQTLVLPSCFSDLPCLLPHLPAFWMVWPKRGTQWFCPPLPPIPLGITGHIWSAENHFIERFWTGSKRLEQLPRTENNIGSKKDLLGHDLLGRKGGTEDPPRLSPLRSQENPEMAQILFPL